MGESHVSASVPHAKKAAGKRREHLGRIFSDFVRGSLLRWRAHSHGLVRAMRGSRFRRARWLSAVQRSYEKEVEPRVNGTTRAQAPLSAPKPSALASQAVFRRDSEKRCPRPLTLRPGLRETLRCRSESRVLQLAQAQRAPLLFASVSAGRAEDAAGGPAKCGAPRPRVRFPPRPRVRFPLVLGFVSLQSCRVVSLLPNLPAGFS